MTEFAPTSLTFDFNKAVADVRHDFAEETKNVTFIDLDAPDAGKQIEAWMSLNPERLARWQAEDKKIAKPTSFGFTVVGDDGTLIGAHSVPRESLGISGAAQAAFFFFHEVGHLFSDPARTANKNESVADGFAAIYGMKKRYMTPIDIAAVASARVWEFLGEQDTLHLTTKALDHIVVSPDRAGFLTLPADQIAAAALTYGQQHGNEAPDDKALGGIGGETLQQVWESASRVALSAGEATPAFYIAARMLCPAFDKHAVDETAGVDGQEGASYWNKVKDEITRKVQLLPRESQVALSVYGPLPS